MYPKVLVISNNPFSETSNNGKTYASFFKGWSKNKLAQIYFTNENPSLEVCGNYFNFFINNSFESKENSINKKNNLKNSLYSKIKEMPIASFIFNILWLRRIKKSEQMMFEFIENFNPEVIFFVGGRLSYTYKMVNLIAEKCDIPIYIYYTDDYFIPENNKIFMKINQYLFLKEAGKTIDKAKSIFVIGNKMKKEYEKKFNKKCIPIMNSIDFSEYENIHFKQPGNQLKIAYFGGLHLKRLDSILNFAKVVEKDNNINDKNTSIDIFSISQLDNSQIEKISAFNNLKFKGKIDSNKIKTKMNEYDVLLFVESFDKEMINRTHLSLSTKIPEYLAVGKPIFAIGPKESGSIEYLKDIGLSYVVDHNNLGLINKEYKSLLLNKERYLDTYKESRTHVKLNHSYERSHEILRKELSSC